MLFSDYFWPFGYTFSRPFYERVGYTETQKDGKSILLINFLGIDEKDVKVSVENGNRGGHVLKIFGETKNEVLGETFRTDLSFSLVKTAKNVEYSLKNGLLQVEVEFDEPAKPQVKISRK